METELQQHRDAVKRAEQAREAEETRADSLRDRLEAVQAEIAQEESAVEDLQAERFLVEERAGRAENRVFELQAQVAAAQAAAELASREAQEARQAAQDVLQDDAARRRLSLLARLRMAWRGE
jgi:chromosome segregation ATPase